ncbi:MAG TPA: HdeA/HdeB family chaperone [Xanthobacteraceae bacterium]|nr:HdeA/HdeB family chaperone [Xanthobacteraceae bacterium]
MKALNIVLGAVVLGAQAVLVTVPARAQAKVDVAKISCNEFLFDKIAPTKSIAVWLSGFYNGRQHNTVVDLGRMERDIDKVEDYCRLNLEMTVMDAAKNALGTNK